MGEQVAARFKKRKLVFTSDQREQIVVVSDG